MNATPVTTSTTGATAGSTVGPTSDVAAGTAAGAGPPPAGAVGYRAGIVGTGFMGRVHARAVRVSGGQVVGVAASSAHRASSAATTLGAERACPDPETLLAADDIDVVHICTPNHLHAPLARAAIAAGKHVVCEKPLATSPGDALELVAQAEVARRVGTVPFIYRFHPMVREARARVAAGELGTVTLVHGTYLQDWLLHPSDDNWRVDPELGGPSRAFADIGSHWCDLAEFVTGDRISRLAAQTRTVNLERGDPPGRQVDTEDAVTLQFETRAGVIGAAVISQVSPGRKNRLYLEVSGSDRTVAFNQEQPELLWVGDRADSRLLVRDPEALSPGSARYARVPAGHPQGYQDCFDYFVADTAAAVAGRPPDGLPTFLDGLRATRIAAAVLQSAATNSWVEVPG